MDCGVSCHYGPAINFAQLHSPQYGGKLSLADLKRRQHHHNRPPLDLLPEESLWKGSLGGLLLGLPGHNSRASGGNNILLFLLEPNTLKPRNRDFTADPVYYIQQHGPDSLKMDLQQIRDESLKNGVPLRCLWSHHPHPNHHRLPVYLLPMVQSKLMCQCWWLVLSLKYWSLLGTSHLWSSSFAAQYWPHHLHRYLCPYCCHRV